MSDTTTTNLHEVPADLLHALQSDTEATAKWDTLTLLGKNEWICWTITCKKPETRTNHIERLIQEVKEGKRRPCCWPGCVHRPGKKPFVRTTRKKTTN